MTKTNLPFFQVFLTPCLNTLKDRENVADASSMTQDRNRVKQELFLQALP